MKPLRMLNKKSGIVLADLLVASSLIMLSTICVIWVILHLWVYNFVNTEAYYLARASLYGNTHLCRPAETLISNSWVDRQHICSGARVETRYKIFPGLFSISKDQSELTRKSHQFTLHLER